MNRLSGDGWTIDDEAHLTKFFGIRSNAELAEQLQRARSEIAIKAKRLQLPPLPIIEQQRRKWAEQKREKRRDPVKRDAYLPWTDLELMRLRSIYPDKPNDVVARLMNRTVKAVGTKASAMGISKSGRFIHAQNARKRNHGT